MIKTFVRKLLPKPLVKKLRAVMLKLDGVIYPLCAKSGFMSSVYYCFFSARFRREHQAVLQGRVEYQSNLTTAAKSSALLRRNTHRLEKALIMQPRRSVFATAYIEETVTCFVKCANNEAFEQQELKWANDVLNQYFAVVEKVPEVLKAKAKFDTVNIKTTETESFVPYSHDQRVKANISPEQLTGLFQQRRSVRWYQDKAVDLNLIKQAVTMATQAPSACNRQPFQYYTVTNPKKASEIAACAMGTQGFSDNIRALVVVVGDLSCYPKEQDRHVIYIDGGLSAMQFMLAAETLGLSTCPINWPDIEAYEKILAKKLNISRFHRPIMMIAVGYGQSAGGIPYSQKKSAEQLIKEI